MSAFAETLGTSLAVAGVIAGLMALPLMIRRVRPNGRFGLSLGGRRTGHAWVRLNARVGRRMFAVAAFATAVGLAIRFAGFGAVPPALLTLAGGYAVGFLDAARLAGEPGGE